MTTVRGKDQAAGNLNVGATLRLTVCLSVCLSVCYSSPRSHSELNSICGPPS